MSIKFIGSLLAQGKSAIEASRKEYQRKLELQRQQEEAMIKEQRARVRENNERLVQNFFTGAVKDIFTGVITKGIRVTMVGSSVFLVEIPCNNHDDNSFNQKQECELFQQVISNHRKYIIDQLEKMSYRAFNYHKAKYIDMYIALYENLGFTIFSGYNIITFTHDRFEIKLKINVEFDSVEYYGYHPNNMFSWINQM